MKRIPLLLLIFVTVFFPRSPWGLTKGYYEKKFEAHGKRLTIDWGLFTASEEKDRLEKQLETLWEAFSNHQDDFRLTRRIEITRSTDLFSLSDEIEKDNDLLKMTFSRSGHSTISEDTILKTLRRRPFLYYTKETWNYKMRKVVRDLGREGYYYEEDGQVKYAAVDTVELFQKDKEMEEFFEQRERVERRKIEEGF
jgi:hypothetical protein